MRLLSIVILCIVCVQTKVSGELSPSACSLLRTATSISTIVPEIAQLAMRYYHVSSSQSEHHRQKRFLFGDNLNRDSAGNPKGSVLEQMVASAFKDVNYTKVALLILHNNESMSRIRQNIDGEVILRTALHNVDYEKLGRSLWHAVEAEFDLEYIVSSFINVTQLDTIHNEVVTTGVLPDWVVKRIHPDLNAQTVDRIFGQLKNISQKFLTIMNSSNSLDHYLYETIRQQGLVPMENILQRIKVEQPTTLDQLVEIILNNVNKVVMEKLSAINNSTSVKETDQESSEDTQTTMATEIAAGDGTFDDVKLLFYQCSIAVDSIGQTARVVLKALEQLYCTTVWE
ncbi:unnamed protein product [Adineta ricciae]|uniref:Uncharacterized protein n=1 Tax=Adineta ricciae TaxID=249248 RepID=A0A815D8G2_ADIRI|nr:unnamed protein product [Adineta ricciae]